MLCDCEFAAEMEAAAGRIDFERVCAPVHQDGLVDSIRFVLRGQCPASRRVLRLLTLPVDLNDWFVWFVSRRLINYDDDDNASKNNLILIWLMIQLRRLQIWKSCIINV